MHPRRLFGDAAVLPSGVWAGTIESRSGSAIATPAPRRKVRRGRCFFVMKLMSRCSFAKTSNPPATRSPALRLSAGDYFADRACLVAGGCLAAGGCVVDGSCFGATACSFRLHLEWRALYDTE